jgi:hypothetical protein
MLACSSSTGGAGSGPVDAGTDSRSTADSGEAIDSGADTADSHAADSAVDSQSDAPGPSAACTTVAGWQTGRPSATCLSCISQAEGFIEAGSAPCGAADATYRSSCGACSSMCAGSPVNLCACERRCDTASCQSLFDALMSCLATECASYCP